MEPTKREQNAEKRQSLILENALRVFAKEGFHRADVQVIADLSSVGKGTVYRHFGNKEELFLAVGKYCLGQLGEFIRTTLAEERQVEEIVEQQHAGQIIRQISQAFAKFYETHPAAVEIMIQERAEFRESVFPTHLMHREETRAELDQLIMAAIEAGQFRPIEAQTVTDTLADLLFGCVVNGCLAGRDTKLVQRVSAAMDLFLHGLMVGDSPAHNASTHNTTSRTDTNSEAEA